MSQPAPSRKSRWRRGVLLGFVALLVVLVAFAVVFRTRIATGIVTAYLESRGVAVQSLAITRLTPDTVEISNIALGAAREFMADGVALVPTFEDFDLGVEAVRVAGLRLTVDTTGDAPLLGSLQPVLDQLAADGGGAQADEPWPLPRIALADAEVIFNTTAGPLAARLDGEASTDAAEMTLRLPGDAESVDLTARARRLSTAAGDEISVTVQGELRTAGRLARLLALPGPAVTAGTLVLEAEGRADPGFGRLSLVGDAVLGEVALADGTTGISAHLPLAAEIAEDRAVLTLREDAAVRVERPARDSLGALGVPQDLQPLLASGLNLTLASSGDVPFRLAASPLWPPRSAEVALAAEAASDQGLSLALQAEGEAALGEGATPTGFTGSLAIEAAAERLALGGREARGVALSLPVTADYGADGLSVALARPGSLRIAGFGARTPLQVKAPLAFTIDTLSLAAAPDAEGYRYALAAREDGAAFTIAAAEAAPVAVDVGALRLQLDGRFDADSGHAASLAAKLAGLTLPGHGFTAEAAEVDIALDRELRPARTRFALGPFRLTTDELVTAPLKLGGSLERAGAGYDLAGEVALPEGRVLADLTGRYRDDGRATLEAVSRLISFAPDGLQPSTLSPLLADLQDVRGTLGASARLAWPREPTRESGRLRLGNLSFKSGGTKIEGLDLLVEFDSLLPLASAAGQRLTMRSLDAGVPVTGIELVFSLDQVPRPRLTVEDGGFDLGGARWRMEPTEIDPAAARNRIVLATEGLDLAAFFDLIDIDGLSGSGKLAGSLPIVFAGNDVIIDDGHFDALGPGRLSIRFQALRSALAGGGEAVAAGARALEDFRYEELSLDIAKTADHDATVRLSTLGQNPDVMEGQPFRFNINLESNLTSVLDALRQGYKLSDDALRRTWRLRQ